MYMTVVTLLKKKKKLTFCFFWSSQPVHLVLIVILTRKFSLLNVDKQFIAKNDRFNIVSFGYFLKCYFRYRL